MAPAPGTAAPPPPPDPVLGVLRSDVTFFRRNGHAMLFDPSADAYYQISNEALQIVQFLSEPLKLSEFVKRLNARGIFSTKEEVARVVGFCQQNNLLVPRFGEIAVKRKKMDEMKKKTWFLRFCSAYLFFKLPPIRPERFFAWLAPFVSWMCSMPVVLSLLVPSLLGYLLLVRDASAVRAAFVDSLSWAGLAKYLVAIVALKIVHESAHSLAAMHFRCRVRGIGIGFMVFVPRLFTDTTDAWRLTRAQRLLIDGAGIMSELLVGGLAALFWCYAPPGPWRSTAFYVFAVSTISTLLVNGNPCIRYDGYYVLSDIMGIPNMMHRSTEYVKGWWRHAILRLGPRPEGDGHGLFLLVFGVCAFIYRIFLYTGIILIIYHKFTKVLALVMMVLELYSILIYPFWREVLTIRALSKRSASHAGVILLFVAAAIVSVVLFLPMGWSIDMYGEISTKQRELVVAEETGFLKEALPRAPRVVTRGDMLCALDAPGLDWGISRMESETDSDRLNRQFAAIDAKRYVEVGVLDEKLKSDGVAMAEFGRRRAKLVVRAAADGVFLPALPVDASAGFHIALGLTLGEILHGDPVVVAYARDSDIGKLSVGDEARVRVADRLGTLPAKIVAIDNLPCDVKASALLQPYGGPVSVYYEHSEDGRTFKPVETLYRVTLEMADANAFDYGRVVHVSVPHREMFWTRVQAYLISSFRREF